MAKRFQTKVEKQAARARTEAHLGGEKKRTKGKAKAAAIKVNGAALDLSGGENPKAKAESIKLHFDELARMQKKADSGNASVRAQKALAKKDHVDTNLLAKVMKIADQEPNSASCFAISGSACQKSSSRCSPPRTRRARERCSTTLSAPDATQGRAPKTIRTTPARICITSGPTVTPPGSARTQA